MRETTKEDDSFSAVLLSAEEYSGLKKLVQDDNPYHLTDAPAFKTLVNAYTSEENNVKMLVEKMCGDSPFKGISPIDPYKGRFTSIN